MQKTTILVLIFLLNINVLTAQDAFQSSEVGDPLSDFTSFEETQEEESLDRFYSYGRFVHIGGGIDLFAPLGGIATVYDPGTIGWLKISYFADWNIALTLSLGAGTTTINIDNSMLSTAVPTIGGDMIMYLTEGSIKYYLNFNEISPFIARINPAFTLGVGLVVLNDTYNTTDLSNLGISIGPDRQAIAPDIFGTFSIEFNIFQNSLLLGLEMGYHFTTFSPYNSEINYSATALTDSTFKYFGDLDYTGNFLTFGLNLIWNLN